MKLPLSGMVFILFVCMTTMPRVVASWTVGVTLAFVDLYSSLCNHALAPWALLFTFTYTLEYVQCVCKSVQSQLVELHYIRCLPV